jgi:hypothetical protein
MSGIGTSTPVLGGVETTSVSSTPLVQQGTVAVGSNGKTYQYVKAGATISTVSAGYLVAIDADGVALLATNAHTVTKKYRFGVSPPVSIASGDYFWAVIQGSAPVRSVVGAVADDTYLRVGTATAGRVAAASNASATKAIYGLVATASKASVASASVGSNIVTVVLINPHAAP